MKVPESFRTNNNEGILKRALGDSARYKANKTLSIENLILSKDNFPEIYCGINTRMHNKDYLKSGLFPLAWGEKCVDAFYVSYDDGTYVECVKLFSEEYANSCSDNLKKSAGRWPRHDKSWTLSAFLHGKFIVKVATQDSPLASNRSLGEILCEIYEYQLGFNPICVQREL